MEHGFEGSISMLFIGDSITDCNRDRDDRNSAGDGFVCRIKTLVSSRFADSSMEIINKGISGDRVDSLLERLDEDCIQLQPDFVNILVGINNTIHLFKRGWMTTPEEFEDSYRILVERVLRETRAKVTVMEPFLLPVQKEGFKPAFIPVQDGWEQIREDLNPKIEIVGKIAREYGIPVIPLDSLFTAAAAERPPEFWLQDGIHPTAEGHELIARAWLETIHKVYGGIESHDTGEGNHSCFGDTHAGERGHR